MDLKIARYVETTLTGLSKETLLQLKMWQVREGKSEKELSDLVRRCVAANGLVYQNYVGKA